MLNDPIAITRCSVLTPLDAPYDSGDRLNWMGTWEALGAGRDVSAMPRVDSAILEGDASLDRSIRLALAVMGSIRVPGEDYSTTGLFCGTSKGPVLTLLGAMDDLCQGKELTRAQAMHVALGVGAMGSVVGRDLKVGCGIHTSVAACASGMFALHRAAGALARGECQRALVIAADASLHPLFEGSFARLGVLAPADADGVRRCEPFGPDGRGFFLSEGAAALLLERLPRPGHALAWLEETWTGADGGGLLAIDRRTQSLRRGLAHCMAGVDAGTLAFVQAHATGTEHDCYELEAIRTAVGESYPRDRIFSHKGQLGHSLGAAGLVGVALSVLSHLHSKTLTGVPMPAGSRSLTIAQGFGGHIALARLRG